MGRDRRAGRYRSALNYSEGEATAVSPLSRLSPAARLRAIRALSSDVTMPGIVERGQFAHQP